MVLSPCRHAVRYSNFQARHANAPAGAFFIRVEYAYGVLQKAWNDKKKTTTKKDL